VSAVSGPEALREQGLHWIDESPIKGFIEFERPVFLYAPRRLVRTRIGAFSYCNRGISAFAVDIGRYCSIGESVVIGAPEHPVDWLSTHPFAFTRPQHLANFYASPEFAALAPGSDSTAPEFQAPGRTTVGHDVWIGAQVSIKRGVTISHGAIIGLGAVVTRDVPPYAIVAGTPARVFRLRFDERIVERLLALAWWQYDLQPLKAQLDFSRVEASLDTLEQALADGRLQRLAGDRHRLQRDDDGLHLHLLPAG
jgi:acetyltransferase-like isoleucine patch superfamily enzyme